MIMNDNKKKILTDEELQEVSGGVRFADISKNFGSALAGACQINYEEELCKKATVCKWEDGKCVLNRF